MQENFARARTYHTKNAAELLDKRNNLNHEIMITGPSSNYVEKEQCMSFQQQRHVANEIPIATGGHNRPIMQNYIPPFCFSHSIRELTYHFRGQVHPEESKPNQTWVSPPNGGYL